MKRLINIGLAATFGVALLVTSSTRCVLASPLSTVSSKKLAPNAYDYYLRAGKALNYEFQGNDFPLFTDEKLNAPFASSWKRREAVLRRNQRALMLMRRGFGLRYSAPAITSEWDVVRYPLFVNTRQIARLLTVESDTFAHRGEYSKSIDSGLDAIRLSKDISRGGLSDYLVGIAISRMGQAQLKKETIAKLSAAEAKRAAQRLENIETRNVSYADVLRAEKPVGLMFLRITLTNANWRKEYPTTKTPQQLRTTYNRLMDEAIINATLPFPQRRSKLSQPDDALNEVLVGIITHGAATTGWFQARDNTLSQIALAQLALRAYRAEHGSFPDALNELAPTVLRRVPIDPFSGKALRYRKTDNEYSLYSIGPDGIDDGGKPLDLPKNRPYAISAEVKGDIVAGINTR